MKRPVYRAATRTNSHLSVNSRQQTVYDGQLAKHARDCCAAAVPRVRRQRETPGFHLFSSCSVKHVFRLQAHLLLLLRVVVAGCCSLCALHNVLMAWLVSTTSKSSCWLVSPPGPSHQLHGFSVKLDSIGNPQRTQTFRGFCDCYFTKT